jgi:hypothetical protein
MKITDKKLGGKMLASGGFGCIFSPALRCHGSKNRKKNGVSKLMTSKNAKDEFAQLSIIKSELDKIPNYKNFFLIDNFSICKPNKLTRSDIENFDKCSALKIDKNNINERLDDLLAINMLYGGITLGEFIMNNKSYINLVVLNNKMVNLLLDGILPMNKMNIYHNDVKDSNILVDIGGETLDENEKTITMNNTRVRIIDWSLTIKYKPFENQPFPKKWRNRPLQFNIPFSVILFTDLFYDSYSDFLRESHSIPNKDQLYIFVRDYLYSWMKERGWGHYKYINKIMYMLFIHDIDANVINNFEIEDQKVYIQQNYTDKYIINYLVEILIHFTSYKSDGTLNMRNYLDSVFIHIVDVWGFVSAYLPLYELFFENYDNLTKTQMILLKKLKVIFLKYLYEPRIEPIDIESLVNNLINMNLIMNFEIINQRKTNKLSSFRKKYKKTTSNKTTSKNFTMKKKNYIRQ